MMVWDDLSSGAEVRHSDLAKFVISLYYFKLDDAI